MKTHMRISNLIRTDLRKNAVYIKIGQYVKAHRRTRRNFPVVITFGPSAMENYGDEKKVLLAVFEKWQ